MRLNFFIPFVLLITFKLCGQTQKFPKGMYESFADFKNYTPSTEKVEFEIKRSRDTVWYKFYNAKTGKRLKKEFAYSDGNDLYVSLKEIIKRFRVDDIGQAKDGGNYCLKAKRVGKRYIYFESYFTSADAMLWGGVIGGAAARRLKGIVYDINKETFDLLKNADDFENFIKENHPEFLPEVENSRVRNPDKKGVKKKNKENIDLIRKIIDKVYDN